MADIKNSSGVDDSYRASRAEELAAERQALADQREAARALKAKEAYDYHSKKYQKEQIAVDGYGQLNRNADRNSDYLGDKVRSVGKFFGINNMTSKDDEAQMQARRDIKGYKKGGSVGSASKRADGCCVKGKTKGRMV